MLAKAFNLLDLAVEWITIVLTGVLVVIVSSNVFARYVLNTGILWAEELSRLIFVWVVFLGAHVAHTRGAHVSMTFITDRLPEKALNVVRVIGTLAVIVFLAVVAWSGYELVARTVRFGRTTPILGISAGWGYASVPISALLMVTHVIRNLVSGKMNAPSQDSASTDHPDEGAGA